VSSGPYPPRHFPGVAIEEETRERLGVDRDEEARRGEGPAAWSKRMKVGVLLAVALIVCLVAASMMLGLI